MIGIELILVLIFIFFIASMKINKEKNVIIEVTDSKNVKLILSLLVFYHHLSQKVPNTLFPVFSSQVGSWAVSAFFLLSGYGLIKKKETYVNKENSFSRQIKKVAVPASIIWLVIVIINTLEANNSIWNSIYFATFQTHLWFVATLLGLYLIFYVFIKKIKKNFNIFYLILSINTFMYMIVFRLLNMPLYCYATIPNFLLGCIVAKYENMLIEILKNEKAYLIKTLLILLLFLVLLRFESKSYSILIINNLLFSVIIIRILSKINISSKINGMVLNSTYYFYLVHVFIIEIFAYFKLNINNQLIFCIASLFISICFSFILCGITQRKHR